MQTALTLLVCPWSYGLLRLDRGVVETIAALNQVFQPLGETCRRSAIDHAVIEAQRHAEVFEESDVPVDGACLHPPSDRTRRSVSDLHFVVPISIDDTPFQDKVYGAPDNFSLEKNLT